MDKLAKVFWSKVALSPTSFPQYEPLLFYKGRSFTFKEVKWPYAHCNKPYKAIMHPLAVDYWVAKRNVPVLHVLLIN
jgi:hypothetical protein